MILPQNAMSRLPEVSMLPRPSLYAFSDGFVHFEAHLSCALLGFSKKKQIVLSNCLEETDKFDLGKKTRSTTRPGLARPPATCRFKDVRVKNPWNARVGDMSGQTLLADQPNGVAVSNTGR